MIPKCLFIAFAFVCIWSTVEAEEVRWFGKQTAPKAIVRAMQDRGGVAVEMMVQSVAGLAAKAVNEGRGDEMVWVSSGNADVERWYSQFLRRSEGIEVRGEMGAWDLVDRFAKRGIIKGYILYRLDNSAGQINEHRAGMDLSVNVATSLAGVLDGILIDQSLEEEAGKHNLKLLLDARDKTQVWCLQNHKDKFNRRLLCTQDPRKPHVRDCAAGILSLWER